MSWSYRVVREATSQGTHYSIDEVYTAPAGSGFASPANGDSPAELLADWRRQAGALAKPVLEWQDGVFVEVEPPIRPADTLAALLDSPEGRNAAELHQAMREVIDG